MQAGDTLWVIMLHKAKSGEESALSSTACCYSSTGWNSYCHSCCHFCPQLVLTAYLVNFTQEAYYRLS